MSLGRLDATLTVILSSYRAVHVAPGMYTRFFHFLPAGGVGVLVAFIVTSWGSIRFLIFPMFGLLPRPENIPGGSTIGFFTISFLPFTLTSAKETFSALLASFSALVRVFFGAFSRCFTNPEKSQCFMSCINSLSSSFMVPFQSSRKFLSNVSFNRFPMTLFFRIKYLAYITAHSSADALKLTTLFLYLNFSPFFRFSCEYFGGNKGPLWISCFVARGAIIIKLLSHTSGYKNMSGGCMLSSGTLDKFWCILA